MAYEQIDGNKMILVNEKGQVREGLSNIEPDYEYEEGKVRRDRWPTIVVQSDSEGTDRRLLPAEVLKLHGSLPQNGHYTRDMFEADDGDKTNCEKDNIIFTGAEEGAESPYKSPPGDEKDDGDPAEEAGAGDESDEPAGNEEKTGRVVEDPMKKGSEADSTEDQKANESGNKIKKQSGDYNADVAVEIIKNNTVADLRKANFVNEDTLDKPRQTVKDAWKKKLKDAEDEGGSDDA